MTHNQSVDMYYGSSDSEDSFHSLNVSKAESGVEKGSSTPATVPSTPELILLPSTPSPDAAVMESHFLTSTPIEFNDTGSPSTSNNATSVNDLSPEAASADERRSEKNLRKLIIEASPPSKHTGQVTKTLDELPTFGRATSTPVKPNNNKINVELDLTEIWEDGDQVRVTDLSSSNTSNNIEEDVVSEEMSKSNAIDSECELLDDQSIEELEGAVGGDDKPVQKWSKSSPSDIDALTERLKKQHLGEKKPMVKYLEQPPVPFQLQNRPQAVDAFSGGVAEALGKIVKAIETMPDPKENYDDFEPPKRLKVQLFPHQIYGAKWMWWREKQYPGGGILADEMGLGKTVISIALILMGKEEAADSPNSENWLCPSNKKLVPTEATLVICPVGCIGQWEMELTTKAKGLRVAVYHGTNRKKSAALLAQNDVVITSYPTVGSEIPKPEDDPNDRCKSPLLRLNWKRLILDEGHIIRNPKTLGAKAICRIYSRHRWVVTGTPIHNKAEDFYSLIKYLKLEPFDDQSVWKHWIGMKNDVAGSNKERLHIIGKAMILRRTKEEVKQAGGSMSSIPPKSVEDVELDMSDSERTIYSHLEEFAKASFKNFLEAQADRQSCLQAAAYTFQGGKAKKKTNHDEPGVYQFSYMFALLTRLRQASVLPFLMKTMLEDEEEDDDVSYDAINDPINNKNPVFEPGYKSSKIRAVLKDLKHLKDEAELNGVAMDKVIIVSQWTSLLDIIGQHLRKKGFSFASITGSDTVAERTDTMCKFNVPDKRPTILLLSMAAGGVGLNLIGANHVFFMEPHWNPQMEKQAQDRVHRFGQTKPVFIRRYIVKDTIESKVLELQSKKNELSDGLMDSTKKVSGTGLNVAAMRTLFGV